MSQIRYITIRNWNVLFFFGYDYRLFDALEWAEAPEAIMKRVRGLVGEKDVNEGFCYSNPKLRRIIVGVGEASSGPEFLDTTIHEITHIAQGISKTDGIDCYGEDFAYIVGDISHEISDIVCEMSCPHCQNTPEY